MQDPKKSCSASDWFVEVEFKCKYPGLPRRWLITGQERLILRAVPCKFATRQLTDSLLRACLQQVFRLADTAFRISCRTAFVSHELVVRRSYLLYRCCFCSLEIRSHRSRLYRCRPYRAARRGFLAPLRPKLGAADAVIQGNRGPNWGALG